jgi:ribosomal protein L12E/L44/L45/RPP1/RPP2
VALLLAELEDVALDDLAQTPSDHAAIAVAAARMASALIMAQGLVEPAVSRIALDFAMLIQNHSRRTR